MSKVETLQDEIWIVHFGSFFDVWRSILGSSQVKGLNLSLEDMVGKPVKNRLQFYLHQSFQWLVETIMVHGLEMID